MSEVPPTRMNEQIFKGKKKAAVGGHKLLKKKADAVKVRDEENDAALQAISYCLTHSLTVELHCDLISFLLLLLLLPYYSIL